MCVWGGGSYPIHAYLVKQFPHSEEGKHWYCIHIILGCCVLERWEGTGVGWMDKEVGGVTGWMDREVGGVKWWMDREVGGVREDGQGGTCTCRRG